MRILAKLVAWMFLVRAGHCASVKFNIVDQHYQPGEELQLTCTVTLDADEPLSASAPKWQKCQDLQHQDENKNWLDVSSGAGIQGVFRETGRFLIEILEDTVPNKRVENKLTITNLQAVDSGIYRCVVTPKQDETTKVSQEIFVYDRVTTMTMITGRDSSLPERQTNPSQVTFIKGTKGYLECKSTGGYPKPTMKVIAGEQQLTGSMTLEENYTLIDPEGQDETKRGLQIISYEVRRYSEGASFSVNDDNKMLFCESSVQDRKELDKSHQASMSIHFAPIINCSAVYHALPETKEIEIQCPIHSRPTLDDVTFVYKGTENNPIHAGDKPEGNFEAIVKYDPDNSELAQAVLKIQEMKPEYFEYYQLEVTNAVGRNIAEFEIRRGVDENAVGLSSQAAVVTPMVILSLVMAVFSLLH